MFNRKIDLRMIDPTSKMSLKMSCLTACKGDVKRAKELYDFMAEGTELPDLPQPRPTFMQQAQQTLDGVFGWFDQNGDKLMKGFNMYQMIKGGTPISGAVDAAQTAANIPPLPPLQQ